MGKINRLIGLLGIAFCALSNVHAVNYYVAPAPTGSDGAAGTQSAPFATISKARDVVKALGTLTEDANVYLRDGWYFQTATIAFNQTNSGTGNFNVIYQAYPNEHPVISGGKLVTGWTVHDATKNIWKATAPAGATNRQLWVNCMRAVRAHMGRPMVSGGQWYPAGSTEQTSTGISLEAPYNVMATWGNPTDIELIWTGKTYNMPWAEKRGNAASITSTAIIMNTNSWDVLTSSDHWRAISQAKPSDIENAYELLDVPGEWYLNRSNNTIYYIPLVGQDMATAKVFTPVLERIVYLKGTGSPVQNIQFKGITFIHGTYLRPNTYGFVEVQSNIPEPNEDNQLANISGELVNNLRFERCYFTHLGGVGLNLSYGAKNCTVIGCVFTDVSANMVQVGYCTDPGRSNTSLRDDGVTVSNCYLHDGPVEFHGGAAIQGGYVSNFTATHNDISYNPSGQITVGWGWSGTTNYPQNNKMTYNKLHDNNIYLAMGDMGPIYTLSAQPNSFIRGNFCTRGAGPGIWYLDQGTAFYTVDSNVNQDNGMETMNDVVSFWLFQNTGSHDNVWRNNYTDYNVPDVGSTNFYVQNKAWPTTAQNIMNNSGLQSAYSDILTMIAGCEYTNIVVLPTVVSANMISANQLELIFNKAVTNASAEAIANYTINNGLTVTAAKLDLSDMQYTHVVLTLSGPATANTQYTLTINNVKDRLSKPSTIAANTQVRFGLPNLGLDLVGWWKLDETSGSTAADASGNGYNGTITGSTSWATGKVANGLNFTNASSGNVAIPAGALGAITGDCAATAWIKVANDAWSKVFSGNIGLQLWGFNTQWQFWGKSNNYSAFPKWSVPAPGYWQHVVLQRKGNDFLLYQNGKKMMDIAGVLDNSKGAAAWSFGGNSYAGMIDDVRLYKRALGESEIQMLASGYAGSGSTDVVHSNVHPVVTRFVPQHVAVYTMSGALVKAWDVTGKMSTSIAINLNKGVYVIRTNGTAGQSVRKMVTIDGKKDLQNFLY